MQSVTIEHIWCTRPWLSPSVSGNAIHPLHRSAVWESRRIPPFPHSTHAVHVGGSCSSSLLSSCTPISSTSLRRAYVFSRWHHLVGVSALNHVRAQNIIARRCVSESVCPWFRGAWSYSHCLSSPHLAQLASVFGGALTSLGGQWESVDVTQGKWYHRKDWAQERKRLLGVIPRHGTFKRCPQGSAGGESWRGPMRCHGKEKWNSGPE